MTPARALKALKQAVEDYRAVENPKLLDDISSGFKLGTAACAYVDSLPVPPVKQNSEKEN